jgi:hypothetical protein
VSRRLGDNVMASGEKAVDSDNSLALVHVILKSKSSKQDEVAKVLEDVLSKSKDVFEIIGRHQKEFIKNDTKSMDFYYNALDQLTGCYMFLAPIVGVLGALEKNRSVNFFYSTKIAFEKTNAGQKFTSAPVEKEADNFVAEERYILSVLSGFLESCRQGIQTCRNRIKEANEEFGLNK